MIHLLNSGLLPSGFTIANRKMQERASVKALDPSNLPPNGIYQPGEVPPEAEGDAVEEVVSASTAPSRTPGTRPTPNGPTLPVFAKDPLTMADM